MYWAWISGLNKDCCSGNKAPRWNVGSHQKNCPSSACFSWTKTRVRLFHAVYTVQSNHVTKQLIQHRWLWNDFLFLMAHDNIFHVKSYVMVIHKPIFSGTFRIRFYLFSRVRDVIGWVFLCDWRTELSLCGLMSNQKYKTCFHYNV